MDHEQRLPFGNDRAICHVSGRAFLDSLRGLGRPVADVSLSAHRKQFARMAGIRIGQLGLTSVSSSPVHFKTVADPQLTFILAIKGANRITERHRVTEFGSRDELVSVSYHEQIHIDRHSSIVGIHPRIPDLFSEYERQQPGFAARVERLTTHGVHVHLRQQGKPDLYGMLLKLFKIVDCCGCDEALLGRVGIDGIFNGILAEAVEGIGVRNGDIEGALWLLEGSRAVDCICSFIQDNVGAPLTIPRMKAMTGLSGRDLDLAFRSRFQCSPIEWQRNFLLDRARACLAQKEERMSLEALAKQLGFVSARSFMHHYRSRFGADALESLLMPSVGVGSTSTTN